MVAQKNKKQLYQDEFSDFSAKTLFIEFLFWRVDRQMMNGSNVYAFFFCAHQGGGLHVRKQRPVEESGEPGDGQQVRTSHTQHRRG